MIKYVCVLAIINIPIFIKIFRVLFPHKGDFLTALSFMNFDHRYQTIFNAERNGQSFLSIFVSVVFGIIILEWSLIWLVIRIVEVYRN